MTYPSASCHGYQVPGAPGEMQSLVDHAYATLLSDLQVAGYEIIPDDAYHATPAYRSLIDIVGAGSPVSLRFKFGDPENVIEGEAMVVAPTGKRCYAPALGEIGSRAGDTLTGVGSEILYARRGDSGGQAIIQAEVELAKTLDAALLKVSYVVSPVRSYVETRFLEGSSPVEGKTILGGRQTRLVFRTPNAPTSVGPFRKDALPLDGDTFVRLKKDVQLEAGPITAAHLCMHLDVVREMLVAKLRAGR